MQYVGPVNDQQKASLLGSALAMLVPIEWNDRSGLSSSRQWPVISSPRGALPEIVTPGRRGSSSKSDEDGVDAVGRITTLSRGDWRARVEEAFTCELVVSPHETLYRQVL